MNRLTELLSNGKYTVYLNSKYEVYNYTWFYGIPSPSITFTSDNTTGFYRVTKIEHNE